MKLPGFTAESSLGLSTRAYGARKAFSGTARGTVLPAKARQQSCETKYGAYISAFFPVTVCRPIFNDPGSSVGASAKIAPTGLAGTFGSRGGTAIQLPSAQRTRFGAFQDCHTAALPFIADVTTTQSCDDSIPDTSVMTVWGHPELTTIWTGGINEIPAPYNPGWFGLTVNSCGCCGGFIECPDGSCKPPGTSCNNVPA